MTDITAPFERVTSRKLDTTSYEAQARIRSRYRAETRFKSYGIAALAVTTGFLVILIANIIMKGLPAFWQHRLVLDVPLKAETIDPQGKKDADVLRAADYISLARDALRAAIPGIDGRAARKQLNEVLSSGAGDPIREAVIGNPGLVGSTQEISMLVSDDVDLYLKGDSTGIVTRTDTKGRATPSDVKGEVTLKLDATDFALELQDIKKTMTEQASALRAEADRLERIAAAEQGERIRTLRADADSLQVRYDQAAGVESLTTRMPSVLVAIGGGLIKLTSMSAYAAAGEVLLPLKSADEAKPGTWQIVTYVTPEANRKVSDRTVAFVEKLKSEGKVENAFNWLFFTGGDSREAELAGIRGAVVGSILTLFITLSLCVPIGVLAAIYLEEFAPKNWLTDIIEININNLAAVPSIVFGLLGLAVFLNFFGLPRSAPLVGGLVLALLVLPTIIIASRAALKAVPPSIKEAALGVGASKQQAIFHHVLPLAMPGIMTGTIIGMAHALGETAPLLMIGMIAFIVDVPQSFTNSATVLPVQIFLWSDLPEAGFQAKTAAAIIVLLVVLFTMNGLAIWLRKRFERRW